MKFTKLQGAGNDFVLIETDNVTDDWSQVSVKLCDRRFGIGADGLLLLLPSTKADFRMRIFNPDGSEAEACGNGLRCFTRYVNEAGLLEGSAFMVETAAGVRAVRILDEERIQVAMGSPVFDPADIPVIVERRDPEDAATPVIDCPLVVDHMELKISCVSMGNPHAVCFLSDPVDHFPLTEIGPRMENHPMFPNRVNFEIANVCNRDEVYARVWERGAGETLACGSGACAVAVISILKGLAGNHIDIRVPGGTLTVDWDGTGEVMLSGPAVTVFHGEW